MTEQYSVSIQTAGGGDYLFDSTFPGVATTVYTQIKAKENVCAQFKVDEETNQPVYVFIPHHAICMANSEIVMTESEAPADDTCPTE